MAGVRGRRLKLIVVTNYISISSCNRISASCAPPLYTIARLNRPAASSAAFIIASFTTGRQ